MSKILEFVPRDTVDARQRVQDFIDHCKTHLEVFPLARFEDTVWDLSDRVSLKGQTKKVRVIFANASTAGARNYDDLVPIREPLCAFVKAYFAYDYALRPIKGMGPRLAAFRLLELALAEMKGSADPVVIDSEVLDRASAIARSEFGTAVAYQASNRLQAIAQFMQSKRMLSAPLDWVSPIKKPKGSDQIGKDADERRARMLPGQDVLDALPKAFRLANDPRAIAVTSVAALLVCAPNRISEVLTLPVDCEVEERRPDGSVAYGLRWRPGKGAKQMVKWIVPSMVPIAKEAIARLRRLSEEPRKVAKWYESNPAKLYIPDSLSHLRNRRTLSTIEVCELLKGPGAQKPVPPKILAQLHPLVESSRKTQLFDFAELETLICSKHPKNFPNLPDDDLRYSELLTLSFVNQYHEVKSAYTSFIEPLTLGVVSEGLSPHSSKRSIFDDLGLFGHDGQSLRVRTHKFRHWLNTLAQSNGLSQIDIAKWSGRLDINQNAAYDHSVTTDEVLNRLRKVVATGAGIYGPLAATRDIKLPISRDEFAQLKIPSVCETDIGYCTHDYIRSPCELHADCINCSELVCIKGDEQKTAMLRQRRSDAAVRLAAEGSARGRATAHLRQTHERLSAMCDVMDDNSIKNGAFIQLNIESPSRTQMAVENRASVLQERPIDKKALAIAKRIAKR